MLFAFYRASDDSFLPITVEAMQRAVEGEDYPYSVKESLRQFTYGDIRLASTRYLPWRPLAGTLASYAGDVFGGERMIDEAIADLRARGELYDFDTLVLWLASAQEADIGCGGIYLPRSPDADFVDRSVIVVAGPSEEAYNAGEGICGGAMSVMHGLGDLMGIQHAGTIICQDAPRRVPQALSDVTWFGQSCFADRYASFVAGRSIGNDSGFGDGDFAAPQKRRAGWISAAQVMDADAGETGATIEDLGASTPGIKALRVRLSQPAEGDYSAWIEYRRYSWLNRNEWSGIPPGYGEDLLFVRYATPTYEPATHNVAVWNFRWSARPEVSDAFGTTLTAQGDRFHDPYRGFAVTRGQRALLLGVDQVAVTVERSALRSSPGTVARFTGAAGQLQTVTLSNANGAAVSLAAVRLSGRAPERFEILADDCTMRVLAAGQDCSIQVRLLPGFDPLAPKHAHLEIDSNDPLRPVATVGLSTPDARPAPAHNNYQHGWY